MSVVSLLGVRVLNNPAPFTAPYEFEITFECLEQLQKDLEWKLTYVGSATSSEYDQELDSLLVGPIPVGVNKFIFEADPPDLKRIPTSEILGVTVILLTCSYDGREFVRVGYYVNNEYDNEEFNEDPPAKPIIERVRRNVLAEKPRVTRFHIKWDTDSDLTEFPPEQPDADVLEDDGAAYGAEELEMEAALKQELDDLDKLEENKMDTGETVEDAEDNESEAGSEDLEAETSGSEDDLEEEDAFEGDDEDVEMGDDSNPTPDQPQRPQAEEMMVH
ncbi:Histone chaperone asf1 [Emydomyces testavorans]|uniref:Histone chaperone n=1 Tax=Emydomyces testavorans TaxID=2070801 RepID=A0AAF0IEM6_9EURO|nr:Histone chaperone asf1 [Emydomyces testavorans]